MTSIYQKMLEPLLDNQTNIFNDNGISNWLINYPTVILNCFNNMTLEDSIKQLNKIYPDSSFVIDPANKYIIANFIETNDIVKYNTCKVYKYIGGINYLKSIDNTIFDDKNQIKPENLNILENFIYKQIYNKNKDELLQNEYLDVHYLIDNSNRYLVGFFIHDQFMKAVFDNEVVLEIDTSIK